MTANIGMTCDLPQWVPDAVRLYLDHTEEGLSLRALARREGCHASTVLRQVRRYENRRDDPLMDEALAHLGRAHAARTRSPDRKDADMTAPLRRETFQTDEATIAREARRILRRLSEPGAVLAIAPDMDKAAVLREGPDGRTTRTGVMDRAVAQAFALKDWISCRTPGRVSSYILTPAGRAALKRMLDEDGRARQGLAEAPAAFGDQHRVWGEREVQEPGEAPRRLRCNLTESPVTALSRRRDKDGEPFLGPDMVAAAERLREDFELAQLGPRVAQNWDRFLTAGDRGSFTGGGGPAEGPRAARERVAAALRDLGPGLGDMALRCCCFLEGLEVAERRMGWSARSGKIVLRIALMRLKRHYEENGGLAAPLIG
ncbi:MAG: helix-turn-helix domain-containing protein [Rhodobacteraceae bacterium]|nr:helix-turn-helix domain-containing protein [Paracoccaceae bacterium]